MQGKKTFCDSVFALAITRMIIDVKIASIENSTTTGELRLALRSGSAPFF